MTDNGASVTIDNGAANITGTSITLADVAGEVLSVSGNANFNGGAGAITIGSLGLANFGTLTFNTTDGAVTVQEDSDTVLAGVSTAESLALTSAGTITDAAGMSLTVDAGDAAFTGTAITLADTGTDVLTVVGNANFNAGAGAIAIGSLGAVNFGTLTFNTTDGAVTVQEDSATVLTGISTADSLTLTSTGSVTDNGASVTIDNGAANITGTSITLADVAGTAC